MRALLQAFDFRSSRYERPNQNWICGQTARGHACRIGPDRRGRCRVSFECQPRSDGAHWTCTRSPDAGGKCADGPRPDGTCCRPIQSCVPIRSLRAKRRQAVLWVVAFVIGFLALALEGPSKMAMLSPGPVTAQHSGIGDCSGCHVSFEGGVVAWIHAGFAPTDAQADSRQCLACHKMGPAPLKPHNLPPLALAQSTKRLSSTATTTAAPLGLSLAAAVFDAPTRAAEDLPCATCHREHQGQDSRLTPMSDSRCQSCHVVKFAAFSQGHPEIERYPYERRTRIVFDHVSHVTRHFEKAGEDKAPGTCTDCHSPAQDGDMMLVGSFATTCAACHLDQIVGVTQVGPKGAAFLAAPGFDLIELRNRGAAIGEWPEFSEQKMTPFMKVLLAGGADFGADIVRLEALDPLDLSAASEEDIAAIERIAWGVKELMHDLIAAGAEDARTRLSAALGMEMAEPARLGRLLGAMPLDVVRATQQAWFPSLFSEVARHRRGEAVPIPGGEEDVAVLAVPVPVEGAGTAADQDILAESDDILAEGEDILAESDDILAESDDILARDDSAAEEAPEGAVAEAMRGPEIDPEAWAKLGGWYRRDFALYFKPLGHADPFMRSWLDVGGETMGTAAEGYGAAVFTALTNKDAPGKCVKCHSVDGEVAGAMTMNWRPAVPHPQANSATRFSHAAHFSLLDEEGCVTCHKLDPQADYQASYKGPDPMSFASNFGPLRVETCAACHVKKRAGDSCLLCHQYHVGTFPTRAVPTKMSKGMN